MNLGRRALAPTALAVAVGVGCGVALATIPDSGGVIHGCTKTQTGQLRVIDPDAGGACTRSEQSLDWSKTGPQGSAGPQGPTGPRGPSDAFTKTAANLKLAPAEEDVTVASLTLPPGKYFLLASAGLWNTSLTGAAATCRVPGYQTTAILAPVTTESLSLTSAIDHPGGAVELTCVGGRTTVLVNDARLSAIQVDTLTEQ